MFSAQFSVQSILVLKCLYYTFKNGKPCKISASKHCHKKINLCCCENPVPEHQLIYHTGTVLFIIIYESPANHYPHLSSFVHVRTMEHYPFSYHHLRVCAVLLPVHYRSSEHETIRCQEDLHRCCQNDPYD